MFVIVDHCYLDAELGSENRPNSLGLTILRNDLVKECISGFVGTCSSELQHAFGFPVPKFNLNLYFLKQPVMIRSKVSTFSLSVAEVSAMMAHIVSST